jgi:hypothetical protein
MGLNWFKRKQPSGFYCRVCGKSHHKLPTDYGYSLPDIVWELEPDTRQAHLDWSTDLCYFEGRWFLRGVLQMPFQFQTGWFGWGIWVEVSEEAIGRFRAVFNTDGSGCTRETGLVANQFPGNTDSLLLKVEVQFGLPQNRPLIYFVEECQHDLAQLQRSGLNEAKYHEILHRIT